MPSLLFIIILLLSLGLLGLTYCFFEARAYRVITHVFQIQKKLPRTLKILHLSDTHFAHEDKSMNRFFDRLAELTYDFVCVTGDIIDSSKGIERCIRNLKKLKPSHGTFVVYGNHDYYDYKRLDVFLHNFKNQSYPKNFQQHTLLDQALRQAGMHVLLNQSEGADFEGTPIIFHGVDDPTTGRASMDPIKSNIHPEKINLFLTHLVDALFLWDPGSMDVAMSGHTHGGQVRIPWIGAVMIHTSLGKNFTEGFHFWRGTHCSISRGIGTSRYFPFRFLCRPEAILLEIKGI